MNINSIHIVGLKMYNFIYQKLSVLLLVFFEMHNVCAQTVPTSKTDISITYLQTKENIRFGVWGGSHDQANPVMFILSSTIEESLGNPYFRQCGDYYGKERDWLCVSIDLPFHGEYMESDQPQELEGWAHATDKRRDFVTENNLRMRSVLDYLIKKNWVDSDSITVCGTSRGGYLAFQYAASDSRVKAVIVFAPVTDLLRLREFDKVDEKQLLPIMNLSNHIARLVHKDIWIVIGDQDTRVGTDAALTFVNNLLREREYKVKDAKLEFNIMHEPKGHTTPKGAVERSIKWLSKKQI